MSQHNQKQAQQDKQAFLNGVAFPIENGETILSFSRRLNEANVIPTLCDDTRLEPYGSCRVCSVDVALTDDGPKKVMASCHTPIVEGMHVYTHSPRIEKLRKNIVELVLSDLPAQTLANSQKQAATEFEQVVKATGVGEVRFNQARKSIATVPLSKNKQGESGLCDDSHPYMRMDLSLCIDCNRCVRACDEIQGEQVLSVAGRGFDARIIKGQDVSRIKLGNTLSNDQLPTDQLDYMLSPSLGYVTPDMIKGQRLKWS